MIKQNVIEVRKGQIAEALANGVDGAMRKTLEAEYDRLDSVVITGEPLNTKVVTTTITRPVTQHYAPDVPENKPTKPDGVLAIMEQQREAAEWATIRTDRTVDLQAWAECAAREIAELETTLPESQAWFVDLWRRDLALAERELARREKLELPPEPDGVDWQSLIVQVKERASLVELVEAYGVELHKSGKTYKGLCPFHADHDPSFVIRPGPPDHYTCYGCDAHGDAIQWVQQARGLRFLEAVRWLAEEYHV